MENEFYTIRSSDGLLRGTAIENEDAYCDIESCNGTQYEVGSTTIVCGCGLNWIDNETAQLL